MNLEVRIPGISRVAIIADKQERLAAIQELFDTSDHGSLLVDGLLDYIAEHTHEVPDESASGPIIGYAGQNIPDNSETATGVAHVGAVGVASVGGASVGAIGAAQGVPLQNILSKKPTTGETVCQNQQTAEQSTNTRKWPWAKKLQA